MGVPVVFLGTHNNATADIAEVSIAGLTHFEKKGTFINRSFFAQGFEQSIPGPPGILPELNVLCRLIELMDEKNSIVPDFSVKWKNFFTPKSSLKGVSFDDVIAGSVKIDGSKWDDLPFVEKDALHFKPVKKFLRKMIDFELVQIVALKLFFAFMMVGAVMTMAGYSVLAERKVSAWMQGRVGPNRTVLPVIGSIPFAGIP